MKLNAPKLGCPNCKGTGAYNRQLKLMVDGVPAVAPSIVGLHCSCLSPELKALHEKLDEEGVLSAWPWSELSGVKTPQADGGPEPIVLGSPYPEKITAAQAPAAPPAPPKVEAKKEEPPAKKAKAGRSKRK